MHNSIARSSLICSCVPCRVCRWERRDGRQIIVSGTLERLVAQLIESNQSEKLAVLTGYTGPDYVYTFLLSHTYFTTSTIFLEKLQEHYFASPPPGLGPGELKVIESKQLGTQTRFPYPPPLPFSLMSHRTAHTTSRATPEHRAHSLTAVPSFLVRCVCSRALATEL